MENILSAITNAVSVVETTLTAMMTNDIVAIFIGASLIGLAAGLFSKMKRSAR